MEATTDAEPAHQDLPLRMRVALVVALLVLAVISAGLVGAYIARKDAACIQRHTTPADREKYCAGKSGDESSDYFPFWFI